MANTFVQGNASTTAFNAASYTFAFLSNVTIGNLLVVAWRRTTAGATFTNVTDNMGVGNTWTTVYETATGGGVNGGWAYVFTKGSGACTVSVNFNTTIGGGIVCIGEWNGANAARFTPAATGGGGATITSNSVVSVGNDLLIGLFTVSSGNATVTPGSSPAYAARESGSAGGSIFVYIEDILIAAGGSVAAQATWGAVTSSSTSGIGDFFAQSFTITGSAGVASATVAYSGPASGSVSADGSGNFSIPVTLNGAYTITPSKTGYVFSPSSQATNLVSANVTGINFIAAASSAGTQGDMLTTNRWCTRLWG